MGYSIGDGIIVLAIAAALVAYAYLRSLERRKRLEILHQERMVAMDKGIPLPELPLEHHVAVTERPPNRDVPLILGIVLFAFGIGTMITLMFTPVWHGFVGGIWSLPLPLALMGLGLVFYDLLSRSRGR